MKNVILTAFLLITGAGSAFASKEVKNEKIVQRQGYIYNFSEEKCEPIKMCDTQGEDICTVNDLPSGQQVFGTDGPDVENPATCDVTLYKVENN